MHKIEQNGIDRDNEIPEEDGENDGGSLFKPIWNTVNLKMVVNYHLHV